MLALNTFLCAGVVTTLAGSGTSGHADGVGSLALFYYPYEVAVAFYGRKVLVTDGVLPPPANRLPPSCQLAPVTKPWRGSPNPFTLQLGTIREIRV